MPTNQDRKLKFIGRQTDKVRNSVIDFYIEPANAPGPRQKSSIRHLIARYETGGASDLPIIDGRREFATGVPNDWSESKVQEQLIGDIDPIAFTPSETKQ